MSGSQVCPACATPLPGSAGEGLELKYCPNCGSSLSDGGQSSATQSSDLVDPLLGKLVGPSRIEALLGRGAFANVYRATHLELGVPVAVKILRPELYGDPQLIKRFQQEARIVVRINNRHVVRIYQVGFEPVQRLHFLVLEFIDGGNLRAHAKEHGDEEGRLTVEEVLDYLDQSVDALIAAAEQGVLHRDLKPENLLVDRSGTIKVSDFGLSKIAEASNAMSAVGGLKGTPVYASPEQFLNRELTFHSDMYSLGATFYHLLTGNSPARASSEHGLYQVKTTTLRLSPREERPEVPAGVSRIIERMTALEVRDRFTTLEDLQDAIDDVRHPGRIKEKPKSRALALVVAVVLVAGGGALAWSQGWIEQRDNGGGPGEASPAVTLERELSAIAEDIDKAGSADELVTIEGALNRLQDRIPRGSTLLEREAKRLTARLAEFKEVYSDLASAGTELDALERRGGGETRAQCVQLLQDIGQLSGKLNDLNPRATQNAAKANLASLSSRLGELDDRTLGKLNGVLFEEIKNLESILTNGDPDGWKRLAGELQKRIGPISISTPAAWKSDRMKTARERAEALRKALQEAGVLADRWAGLVNEGDDSPALRERLETFAKDCKNLDSPPSHLTKLAQAADQRASSLAEKFVAAARGEYSKWRDEFAAKGPFDQKQTDQLLDALAELDLLVGVPTDLGTSVEKLKARVKRAQEDYASFEALQKRALNPDDERFVAEVRQLLTRLGSATWDETPGKKHLTGLIDLVKKLLAPAPTPPTDEPRPSSKPETGVLKDIEIGADRWRVPRGRELRVERDGDGDTYYLLGSKEEQVAMLLVKPDPGAQWEAGGLRVPTVPFLIDKFEVTFKRFGAFLSSEVMEVHDPERMLEALWEWRKNTKTYLLLNRQVMDERPVLGIGYEVARRYAEWAGKTLPEEEQWLYAAAYDAEKGLQRFPWGQELTKERFDGVRELNNKGSDEVLRLTFFPACETTPELAFDTSPWRVRGMGTGPREWCLSPGLERYVARGMDIVNTFRFFRVETLAFPKERWEQPRPSADQKIGFRCVVTLEKVQ